MNRLVWREAERLSVAPDIPCYEAKVKGGKYRAAPVVYVYDEQGNRTYPDVGYEAFFIPDGAKSAADVRNIAERLTDIDDAKAAAEHDYAPKKSKRIPVRVQRWIDSGHEVPYRQADPSRWYCSGYCPRGIPRVYGRGDTAEEAETNARIGALQRDHKYQHITVDVGLAKWTFVTFPPWKDNDDGEKTPDPTPTAPESAH
jgi:hypothetical protein